MKVKEFLELFKDVDPEREVIIASDPEGNSYIPVTDIDDNVLYNKEEESIGLQKLTPELKKKGYTKEDLGEGVAAVVIWP
jgi:hypothetical protein